MIKKLLLLSLLLFVGCDRESNARRIMINQNDSVRVLNIEECEYLSCGVNGGIVYTHKGNCTNDAHKLVLVLPIPVEVEKKREYSFK